MRFQYLIAPETALRFDVRKGREKRKLPLLIYLSRRFISTEYATARARADDDETFDRFPAIVERNRC